MGIPYSLLVFLLLTTLTHNLSVAVNPAPFEQFTAAVSKFSSELYQQSIESTLQNVVISSYSTINAFLLLAQMGNGKTLDHLKRKLSLTGNDAEFLDNYVEYQKSLTKSAQSSKFVVANKLYVEKLYKVNEKFQEIATQKLSTGVEMIFLTNRMKAAKIINDFVWEKTQSQPSDIIKPENLNGDPRILLMNTIYMKLNFEKIHQRFTFENDRFSTYDEYDRTVEYKDVEYMKFIRGDFKYAELNDIFAQAIEIRFADSDFSLIIIMPNFLTDFRALETTMRNFDLTKIIDQMRPKRMVVKIPIFQSKYQISLKNRSNQMQILDKNIFDMYKANLTKLFNDDNYVPLHDAILTTIIDFDSGNKPDKKTDEFLFRLSYLYSEEDEPLRFEANRAFMYHIWDRKTNTSVFSGCLKEFEGIRPKIVYPPGQVSTGFCVDVNGMNTTCNEFWHQEIFASMSTK